MKYIIHGATGAQGSPLFKKLLKEGKNAVAAVRDPSTLAGAPAVAADLSMADSLAAAYADAEGVFVHLPLAPEDIRLQYARNISKAIGTAKPKRVVISTSGWSRTYQEMKARCRHWSGKSRKQAFRRRLSHRVSSRKISSCQSSSSL